MSYYHVCPHCGAHLDPGESCRDCKEKAAQGAANALDGKVEKVQPDSTSHDTRETEDLQA